MKIVTEALGNCVEHSGAANVSLLLRLNDDHLYLEITDDGCGFEPDKVGSGHYGLIGIRERAQILGGNLSIESSAEKGTILTVVLPGDRNG